MADKILYEISVDTSSAEKALEAYRKSIESINNEFEKLSKTNSDKSKSTAKEVNNQVQNELKLLDDIKTKQAQINQARANGNDPKLLKQFNDELRTTQKELTKVQGLGKSAFGSILESAKSTFAGMAMFSVAQSAIGSIQNIFSTGFNASVNAEQFLATIEVMLGSTEKAKQMLQELTDFAAKTPFELAGIQRATQTLLQFGVEGEDIMKTIKFLGDASAGNQEKFNSLALAFGQVKASGRLMGQEVLQMINAGFNPLQQISKDTGKSMIQLKKDMENGLIGFDQVEKAFVNATSKGGRFFNLMEKQSTTTGGKLSTLKDNFTLLLKDGFDALLPAINWFIDSLSSLIVMIGTFFSVIGKLPKFLKDNAELFILLGGALFTLNLGLVSSTASMIAFQFQQMALIAQTRILNGLLAITNALTRLNPFGLMVTGITAAITAILYFNKVQKESNELREKAIEQLSKELTTLDDLVIVATSAARSQEERKNAIAQINELYGQYIPFLLTERSSLIAIKEAQDEATRALINNTLEKMKAMELQTQLEEQLKNQMKLSNQIDRASSDINKEALGASIRKQREIANEITQQEELAQQIDRVLAQSQLSIDTAKKVDKEQGDALVKKGIAYREEALALQKQQKDIGLLKKEFTALSMEQFKLITGYDAQSGLFDDLIAKGKLLFNGEKLALLENLKINQDSMLQRGKTIREYTVAFEGLTDRTKQNTKEIQTNVGAGTGSTKQWRLHVDAIHADTKAIEQNTEKLIDSSEALKTEAKLREQKTTSLTKEIILLEKSIEVQNREAKQRKELAQQNLLEQFNKEKAQLDKDRQQAQDRLNSGKAGTNEIEQLRFVTTKGYETELNKLKKNFAEENVKILQKSQLEMLEIDNYHYNKRTDIIQLFIIEQKRLIQEGLSDLRTLEYEFQQVMLNDYVGTLNSRFEAERMQKQRLFELENETRLNLLKEQRLIETELETARENGESDKVEALEQSLQRIEVLIFQSNERIYQIETNSIIKRAKLKEDALQKQIEGEREFIAEVEGQVEQVNNIIGKMSAGSDIGQKTLALLQNTLKLRLKYRETAAFREIELEKRKNEALIENEIKAGREGQKVHQELIKKREELNSKDLEAERKFNKEKFNTAVDAALQAANLIIDSIRQVTQAQIEQTDALIAAQERRVSEAEKIAEKGNAVQLKLEKERLDNLTKERERFVRRQQALATIELIANSIAAIAKAANNPFPYNVIAIAATVAALGAGLISAKAKSTQAASGFAEGGYTGDGGKYERAGDVHRGEFVITKEKTAKFRPLLEAIHNDKISLRDLQPTLKHDVVQLRANNNELRTKELESKLADIENALIELPYRMPNTSVSIDEHGIYKITEKKKKIYERLKK